MIYKKFQVRSLLGWAFINGAGFQWKLYEEFFRWSTLNSPSKVSFKDSMENYISVNRASSTESRIVSGQNQTIPIVQSLLY